jgi:cysteine-rich repeat protein
MNLNKFPGYFLVLAFVFTCLSAQADEQNTKRFHKSQFIVKFKTDGDKAVEEDAGTLIENKLDIKPTLKDKSDSLDKLNHKFKVKRARAMFTQAKGVKPRVLREKFREEKNKAKLKNQARTKRIKQNSISEVDLSNTFVVEVEEGQNIEDVIAEFKKDPHVEFAQPDYFVEANYLPNDPYYKQNELWGLNKISMPAAWDQSQGENITVAVVDTGIDYNHGDLKNNMWTNSSERMNGIDDDANGYIDDVMGYDFTTCETKLPDNDPMDGHGHGTHVAGTIAAQGNNSKGVIGVAPKVKLMAAKGLCDSGSGLSSQLAEAIIYAARNGADVINNSWGCGAGCPSNPIAEEAVREAVSLGAVVVFAAGNSNANVDLSSPANMKEVIAVAASDNLDKRATFSNFGGLIDIAAPGVNIASTYLDPSYTNLSGTSMASPHVAGAAALILSKHPEFTPEQVRQVIMASADELDYATSYPYSGPGRLNVAKALTINAPLNSMIKEPLNKAVFRSQDNIVIKGDASGTLFKDYQIFYKSDAPNQTWTLVETLSKSVNGDVLSTLNAAALPIGKYLLRLVVHSADGNHFDDVSSFYIDGPNQPPVIEPIPDQKWIDKYIWNRLPVIAHDPNPGDVLTLSVEYPLGPFGASFSDYQDGTGSFFLGDRKSGHFQVLFKVTDGQLTSSQLVNIDIGQCENGILEAGEECDDGNNNKFDSCTVCRNAECGDGFIWIGVEQCDYSNSFNNPAVCTMSCREPRCGDGYLNPAKEECDDQNLIDNDGCSSKCKLDKCGDGKKQSREECDDGNTVNEDQCTTLCRFAFCGDGFKQPTEQCDDGNMVSGDGCSYACKIEKCGDQIKQINEECDDGNTSSNDGCSSTCTKEIPLVCGNSVVQVGEECDDGNSKSGDGCSANCEFEVNLPLKGKMYQNLTNGPIAGAKITLNGKRKDGLNVHLVALSDANGQFILRNLGQPMTSYTVNFDVQDKTKIYTFDKFTVTDVSKEVNVLGGFDRNTYKGYPGKAGHLKITGYVKAYDGKPLKDVEIRLDEFYGNSVKLSSISDPKGYFVFENLPEGQYDINVPAKYIGPTHRFVLITSDVDVGIVTKMQ